MKDDLVKKTAIELFEKNDFDGSGAIEKDELRFLLKQLFKALEGEINISNATMDLIMRRMDKNHDRQISLEEFVSFFDGDEEE